MFSLSLVFDTDHVNHFSQFAAIIVHNLIQETSDALHLGLRRLEVFLECFKRQACEGLRSLAYLPADLDEAKEDSALLLA